MSDLISRTEAIEAVHKYFVDLFNDEPYETDEDGDVVFTDMKSVNALLKHNKEVSKAIKALPSATKKLNNQIHLCDSCKYNYPKCPSENEDVLFGNGVGNDNICCCAKYIVSAEAVQGEWIGYNADKEDWLRTDGTPIFLVCDKCHGTVINNGSAHWNFCPNCGAKMKGGDTE